MIIKNVTKNELEYALRLLNKKYKENIVWNRFDKLNNVGNRFAITLRVKDSHKIGARLGYMVNKKGNRRHLINACWHVHGDFFDLLLKINSDVEIKAEGRIINKYGGNWQDSNIGSLMNPLMYSEACECYMVKVKLPVIPEKVEFS